MVVVSFIPEVPEWKNKQRAWEDKCMKHPNKMTIPWMLGTLIFDMSPTVLDTVDSARGLVNSTAERLAGPYPCILVYIYTC